MALRDDALRVAVEICERFEGFRSEPYLCSAGVPTIGIGTTVYPDGRRVTLQDPPCTRAQAIAWKTTHLARDVDHLLPLVASHTDAQELGAMVSLAYNVGRDAVARSTLLRHHNARDTIRAALAFTDWRNAGGQPSRGLLRRRMAEASVYLEGRA